MRDPPKLNASNCGVYLSAYRMGRRVVFSPKLCKARVCARCRDERAAKDVEDLSWWVGSSDVFVRRYPSAEWTTKERDRLAKQLNRRAGERALVLRVDSTVIVATVDLAGRGKPWSRVSNGAVREELERALQAEGLRTVYLPEPVRARREIERAARRSDPDRALYVGSSKRGRDAAVLDALNDLCRARGVDYSTVDRETAVTLYKTAAAAAHTPEEIGELPD